MFAVMRGIIFQDTEDTVLLVANRLETVEVILGNVANRIQECLPRAVQSPCCFSGCCHLTSILTACRLAAERGYKLRVEPLRMDDVVEDLGN
jgi:hypothetical protein